MGRIGVHTDVALEDSFIPLELLGAGAGRLDDTLVWWTAMTHGTLTALADSSAIGLAWGFGAML